MINKIFKLIYDWYNLRLSPLYIQVPHHISYFVSKLIVLLEGNFCSLHFPCFWVVGMAQSFNLSIALLLIETTIVLDILCYYFGNYADYFKEETIAKALYSIMLPMWCWWILLSYEGEGDESKKGERRKWRLEIWKPCVEKKLK